MKSHPYPARIKYQTVVELENNIQLKHMKVLLLGRDFIKKNYKLKDLKKYKNLNLKLKKKMKQIYSYSYVVGFVEAKYQTKNTKLKLK